MTAGRLTFNYPLSVPFSVAGVGDSIVSVGPLPEGAVVSAVEIAAQAIGSDTVDALGVEVSFAVEGSDDLAGFAEGPLEFGALVVLPAAGSCSDGGTFVPTFLSTLTFERLISNRKRFVNVRLNSAGGNWTSVRGVVSVIVREGLA